MEIYRYISFERFREIVENKTLYFVNPFTKWSDNKEGFLYRAAQKSVELTEIDKALVTNSAKKIIIEQLKNGGIHKEGNLDGILDWFGMRCQSWSKSKNDHELWKEYSCDNCSVSIAVDTSKLLSLHCGNQKVEGFDVEYKKELNIEDDLNKAIGRHGEFYFPFILKSKLLDKFGFENEYRLYLTLLDTKGHFIGENHEGVNVDINYDIEVFINGVYCHPDASNDFKTNVKEYCKKHALFFRE